MKRILLLSALALSACGGDSVRQAQSSVYAVEAAYNTALAAAVAYTNLPPCPANEPVCYDVKIGAQVQAARKVASASLDEAERVVRDPKATADAASAAVATATGALRVLSVLTTTLPTEK